LAFHGLNDSTYDAVYFRPFNFKNLERSNHSVQYISHPKYTWYKLREENPGKYENTVKPIPNPEEWFHAAIVVEYPIVKVFLNNSEEPSLTINQLSTRISGKIGFWVGNNSEGYFKNLKILIKYPDNTNSIDQNVKAQINTKVNFNYQDKVPLWLAENKVLCVGIGIIENGELRYVKVFGELQQNVPAPKNAIFEIASMVKPVVAMLTLKLVQAGQWNLDEPLAKYWVDPDLLDDTLHNKLTTRHVLTHQTGFPNWRNGKLRFEFEPGTKFQYSGEGLEYLRRALESKFKKTLVQLSDSILFKPLGMKDTRYSFDENMDITRYAIPHDGLGNKYEISKNRGVNAAALLLTTIEDYSKFMIYVMNGAELSPSLYNDMIRSQVAEKKHVGRGLGWEIVSDLPNGEFTLQHGGSNMGVKTMCIILPKSKRGVVVFTNGENGITVYNNVIKESLDEGQQILNFTYGVYNTPSIVKLSNEILERYIGTYARLDIKGWNINITKEGDILKVSGESLPIMDFLPYAEDKFFMKGYGFQYEFIKDESNKVIKLNIYENGKLLLDAKKIK
jgi:CubicO group peptidase (beta-lactamase class C family)